MDRTNRSCEGQMAEKTDDVSARLQHPRRSLGNRHRSQSEKFLSLAGTDPQNLDWAEQSARQAVLHDFTNPQNWRTLVQVKLKLGDESGIRAVLNELFTVSDVMPKPSRNSMVSTWCNRDLQVSRPVWQPIPSMPMSGGLPHLVPRRSSTVSSSGLEIWT